ncbi:hypothetical protein ThrDRAFT_01435 [Frankia casuarinae]|nr:hypothetical protein CcI6DRAFT_01520 [Frankia sp. CcI6]EYT92859.1 hypothetical protein ThrDRAFT_01435 [Frankia casuarinae]OAA30339.1 hypothetical protein AAY23_1010143 [Frankia casuarinae]
MVRLPWFAVSVDRPLGQGEAKFPSGGIAPV